MLKVTLLLPYSITEGSVRLLVQTAMDHAHAWNMVDSIKHDMETCKQSDLAYNGEEALDEWTVKRDNSERELTLIAVNDFYLPE